jgi:hypothetical protein
MAAVDMGRSEIDPVAVRKKHYDQWTKHLALLNDDADIRIEARKLVEHAILTAIPDVLPITGYDLIAELGIRPGPLVGTLLEQARVLCNERRRTREELLAKLREYSGPAAHELAP